MKISDFAKVAGTTPRAVRHYHRLGLLPEPPRRANGYREYELQDLIGLLRITRLAGAGVPLAKVGEMLAGEADHARIERDLDLVQQMMTEERDRLDRQLEALAHVKASLGAGSSMSALPRELTEALERVEAAATTEEVRAVIASDRELLELLALSGGLTAELASGYASLADDPDQLHQSLQIAAAFGALEGRAVDEVDAEIDKVVRMLLDSPIVTQHLLGAGDEPPPTPEEAELFLDDPAQREVVLRLLRGTR